ncbi:MAG: hypothetical protein ABJA69_08240 [Acidobacteriaceae bacterium]
MAIVSIEMKLKSKSSIDQVTKYALLGLVMKKREQQQKQHYLLLLGRGTLEKQFKEKFGTIDDLKQALSKSDISGFLSRKSKWQGDKERFGEILRAMKIVFWNYESFSKFLQDARPSDADKSLGAEVFRKLFDGFKEVYPQKTYVTTNRAGRAIWMLYTQPVTSPSWR